MKNNENTTKEQILDYLKKNKRASTMELIERFKTTTPSRFIGYLKQDGHNILTTMETNPNTGKMYGVYIYQDSKIKDITDAILDAKQKYLINKDASEQIKEIIEKVTEVITNE